MNKIAKTILWGLLAAAWLSEANAWAQADPLEQGAISCLRTGMSTQTMKKTGGP